MVLEIGLACKVHPWICHKYDLKKFALEIPPSPHVSIP